MILCDTYPSGQRVVSHGRVHQKSRWRLIIAEYMGIRGRLLNSDRLLEETNLHLYTINETTLMKWYKQAMRRGEVRLLMQGMPRKDPLPVATTPLPPAQARPSSPPPPPPDHIVFEEPEDTTGLARIRNRQVPQPSNEITIATLKPKSRTTEWRKRKKEAAAAAASTSTSTAPANTTASGE